MKTIIISINMLLIISLPLFSQRPKEIKNKEVKGLYLTHADFKANKLTFPIDKQHKEDKIKLKQFFFSPEILSMEQHEGSVYYKDSIFAIQLSNGENYRFIDGKPCRIADTSYLIIYFNRTVKTEYEAYGPHRKPKDVPVTCYYFSIPGKQDVYALTMDDLRKYVLSSPDLHYAVCNKYTNDEMLQRINPQTGRFEVNETMLKVMNQD